MKVSQLQQLIESSVRKVVREEIEYYFDKLNEVKEPVRRVVEQRRDTLPTRSVERHPVSEPKRTSRPNLADKYRNILTEMVFEETEPFSDNEEDLAPSILDETRLKAISNSGNLDGVYKALTRDYSQLVNKWNSDNS